MRGTFTFVVVVVAAGAASVFYYLPLIRLLPVCCNGSDCQTISEPLSGQFQYEVSQWSFPRYVDEQRRTFVSFSTRRNHATEGVIQKFTAQTAAWVVRNTPKENRPQRWPKGPMTKDHCCYVYRVALSEEAWNALPAPKKQCQPDMGLSPYWQ